MNDPRYLHTEEKQEGETFFDVMNRLIARSKAVTADMEAVLAELESEIEPFRAPKDHEYTDPCESVFRHWRSGPGGGGCRV